MIKINIIRRRIAAVMICALAWVPFASAQSTAAFVEGQHYVELQNPLPVLDPERIEVVEFFWYGCIHCYHFEPVLRSWQGQQADDVVLRGSPVVWNKIAEVHARAYYSAQSLGVLEKVHGPLFAALNTSPPAKLNDEDALAEFFAQYGVDEAEFRKAFNSFGVSSLVRQADARVRSAQIDGTPSLLVNGKYRVTGKLAGGLDAMLDVADFLIEKERSASPSAP